MNGIEYELREQDLIAFSEHQMQESAALQKRIQRHQAVMPGFMALISLFLWFYYKDTVSAAFVAVVALSWGFLVPAYLKWSLRRQMRGMYSDADKERLLGVYSLSVEDDALVERKQGGEESRIPWNEILRIETTKKYAFVFVDIDSALIIPRATIRKGKLRDFVRAADQRIEAAA
jgi:hypothetical protein